MQLDDALYQRKPNSEAALPLSRSRIALRKGIEDVGQDVWRDSDAIVLDHNAETLAQQIHSHPNVAALWSELECVLKEVSDRLFETFGIGVDVDCLGMCK